MFQWHLFVLIAIFNLVPTKSDLLVSPSCEESAELCSFNLVINYNYTMTRWKLGDHAEILGLDPLIWHPDGHLDVRQDCGPRDPLKATEKDSIQFGDGTHKRVILFNGQLPGPPIVVYENQQVVVKVFNGMDQEATMIHWHGIRQFNTPWMDGAGTVSQCPIKPHTAFTYRFLAENVGTHWYHSHQASQRSMGAYGPLIVLSRKNTHSKASHKPKKSHRDKTKAKQPNGTNDHVMMISDWFQEGSLQILHGLRRQYYNYGYSSWFSSDKCYKPTRNVDGVEVGIQPFYAALINGRGHSSDPNRPRTVPEVFHVKEGQWHYFRIINAGMFFFLRVSIDHHDLHVTSSDGHGFQEAKVESVVVGPGERYDFWIIADDPLKTGSYMVRVETTEYYYNLTKMSPHSVEGVLHYEGAEVLHNATQRQACTAEKKCRVLNCPFKSYNEEDHIICIPITELQGTEDVSDLHNEDEDILEVFMKLQFTGVDFFGVFKPTINGVLHRPHTVPPQIYPPEGTNSICAEPNNCTIDACYCTHELQVPLGQLVQLVIFTHLPQFSGNSEKNSKMIFPLFTPQKEPITVVTGEVLILQVNSLLGTAHTLHIHGHHFEVVKMGWPNYNETGLYASNTDDIACEHNDKQHGWTCHSAKWANSSSEVSHRDPQSGPKPLKDTVLIPAGGYAVVRFRADNPGYWLMHCHMEIHYEMGMAMVLRVGEISQMNQLPKNFPTCGSFDWSAEGFKKYMKQYSQDSKVTQVRISSLSAGVGTNIAIVLTVGLGIFLIAIFVTHLPSIAARFQIKLPLSVTVIERTSSAVDSLRSSETSPLCATAAL